MNNLQSSVEAAIAALDNSTAETIRQAISSIPADKIAALENPLGMATSESEAFALLGREAGPGALGQDPEQAGRGIFANRRMQTRSGQC